MLLRGQAKDELINWSQTWQMTNHWSFIIKKTLYYNNLDTEDFILLPVNSDDDDENVTRNVTSTYTYTYTHLFKSGARPKGRHTQNRETDRQTNKQKQTKSTETANVKKKIITHKTCQLNCYYNFIRTWTKKKQSMKLTLDIIKLKTSNLAHRDNKRRTQ